MGASVSEEMWLVFSGATLAPYGTLHEEGFRLRTTSGYGEYDTDTQSGSIFYQSVLFGYQTKFDDLTVAAYLGLTAISRQFVDRQTFDDGTWLILFYDGIQLGTSGALDLWYEAGGDVWMSLNASYTTAYNTYAARGRLGLKLTDDLSIGPELCLDDNSKYDIDLDGSYQRAGGFARYNWGSGEISLSAGISRQGGEVSSPYLTIGIYTQY